MQVFPSFVSLHLLSLPHCTAHSNPFEPQPLDSNPFDSSSDPSAENPFTKLANDSAFSLGSEHTETPTGYGVGYGRSAPAPALAPPRGNAALDERERALRAREEAITAREEAVGVYQNNWPIFFPVLHHDLSTIPSPHGQTVTLLYYQWLALIVTLIFNLLGCIFLLVAGSSEGGADTAAAGGYVPVIGIASFILWYRPIYLGYKRLGSRGMAFFFYIFFLFAGFHLAFSIYMAIGIPSTGSAGLINTISMFSQAHILAGVFGVISSVGWILQAAGGGLLYKRVWDYKNGNSEINFQEATNQFKSSSIKTIVLHQSRM
ncbi:secretory carrier-associated membrane protein, partial [Tremellales sp. Uapishka_1]